MYFIAGSLYFFTFFTHFTHPPSLSPKDDFIPEIVKFHIAMPIMGQLSLVLLLQGSPF